MHSRSAPLGWIGLATAIFAGAEWLRHPALGWAVVAAVGALVSLPGRAVRGFWALALTRLAAWALLLILAGTHLRLARIEADWPREEGRRRRAVEAELSAQLAGQVGRLRRLADAAAEIPLDSQEEAFYALERLVPSAAPEVSLSVLAGDGTPLAWAGLHRLPPGRNGDSLAGRTTAYYATLEVRRHHSAGAWVVATALLDADSATAAERRTLVGPLERRLGASLLFSEPETAGSSLVWPTRDPILAVRTSTGTQGAAIDGLLQRTSPTSRLVAALMVLLTVGVAVGGRVPTVRFAGVMLLLWLGLRSPIGEALGFGELFSPAVYFTRLLGPFSSSTGALALTGLVGLIGGVWLWTRPVPAWWFLTLTGIALLAVTPYFIRELGRGITPPAAGVSLALWWAWHVALLLPAACLLIVSATLLRARLPGTMGTWPAVLAGGSALLAAGVGILVFTGRPAWPVWYTALWIPPVVLAVWPARRTVTMIGVAMVAGAGASLMTWGAALAGRTDLALRDVEGLDANADPLVEPLLAELASELAEPTHPVSPTGLYQRWRTSALAGQGYPGRLALWRIDGSQIAEVRLDEIPVSVDRVREAVTAVEGIGVPTLQRVSAVPGPFHLMPGPHHLMAVRLDDAHVATVLAGPRTALIAPAPLGRLLVTGPERTSQYRLALAPFAAPEPPSPPNRWRREGWALRYWRPVTIAGGTREVHAFIPLGRPPWIQVRGALLVLLDGVIVSGLWLLAEVLLGRRAAVVRWRELARSYRARIAVALALFCAVPAALLVGLSLSQLAGESGQTGDLVLRRILRDATPSSGFPASRDGAREALGEQAGRVDADLALYQGGRLVGSSEPILEDLAFFPPLLDSRAYRAIHLDGDVAAAPRNGHSRTMVRSGYTAVALGEERAVAVLATVAPATDRALRERRADLAVLLLLATLVGVLAALLGARFAARALARPVTDLRDAALAFGAGRDPGLPGRSPPPEFVPVFDAFGRMASDVRASQHALEAARRRTDAVLARVTTGVVAVDARGRVLLANRQAAEALGRTLTPGEPFAAALSREWVPVRDGLERLLAGAPASDEDLELEAAEHRYAIRFAPLESELGGLVLAINDVTETTRATRVLAWAEVANQVAHAIKNPLTPLRLGIQHLQRVRATRPAQLDRTLAETGGRILAEIERLDSIARAFARFAAPSEPTRPLEEVDVAEVAREVAGLYHLAPGVAVRVAVADGTRWLAQRDELKEVLFNLFENARNAGAQSVTVRGSSTYLEVQDDGLGIPPHVLPRVFEPRFSTTSSGSGLGLAIVRRLVEAWGARVEITSRVGEGTVVLLTRDERGEKGEKGEVGEKG